MAWTPIRSAPRWRRRRRRRSAPLSSAPVRSSASAHRRRTPSASTARRSAPRASRRRRRHSVTHWSPPSTSRTTSLRYFKAAGERGAERDAEWQSTSSAPMQSEYPELAADAQAGLGKHAPGRLGQRPSDLGAGIEADLDAQSLRRGDQRLRAPGADLHRWLGRSQPVDEHRHERRWRFRVAGRGARSELGAGALRWRLGLRRAQHPLRYPRARHGQRRQRHGRARRGDPLHGDLPRLRRLHASADSPRRALRPQGDLRLHPRQHRRRRGWPDARAGRATGQPARHPEAGHHPAGGRQ